MAFRLDKGQIEVIDEAQAEVLRHKTPFERLAMAIECNRTARLLIEGRLRTDHPDWGDRRIAAGVAARMLGESR